MAPTRPGAISLPPLEKIIALQNRRVRAIVAHAYNTVPYYREVMNQAGLRPNDFRTAGDLAKLPILASGQLVRAPEQFLSHRYSNGKNIEVRSSGTAGRPKRIHYDPAALFLARVYR